MNLDGVRELGFVKDFGSDFITYNIEDDLVTFKDVMASSKAKQWKEAVKSEMDSIVSNGTWFKARLVAKSFKQKEEIDYCYTYSPIGRLTMIRVLIALASVYNFLIHQMHVKTSFLYGELEEKIYMDQLEGFVAYGSERKYLPNGMGLDISFSVSKLARYTSCLDKIHWGALDSVLRYLKGTVLLAIHYGRFPVVLEGYSDAS
ncbi:Copia protein [Sesamum angolense]|uniref:Copia protein n=1 Tax=Sesamum angolense TaxID=2727404 RepID=A0AAE1T494_9LAMI|nr:Copia protein [Sesamum angolense]